MGDAVRSVTDRRYSDMYPVSGAASTDPFSSQRMLLPTRVHATVPLMLPFPACSSVVVPVVLGLSVLLVWVLWYKVAHWRDRKLVSSMWCCFGNHKGPGSEDNKEPAAASSADGLAAAFRKPFGLFLLQQCLVTLLVLFFESYDKLAQVSLGMLWCVELGEEHRWVMDVRLACPRYHTGHGWTAGVLVFGCLLMCVCCGAPLALAGVLCWRAYDGKLGPNVVRGGDKPCRSCCGEGFKSVLRDILEFRYIDYNVQYTELKRKETTEVSPQTRREVWRLRLLTFLSQFRLSRLQLWLVLAWDSVIDLHRMMLAVVSLCVEMHELNQLLLVVIVLSSYLALILAIRPWKANGIWRLQVLALLVLLASCFGITASNVSDSSTDDPSSGEEPSHMEAIRWAVLAGNIFYMFVAACVLVRSMMPDCRLSVRGLTLSAFTKVKSTMLGKVFGVSDMPR